MEILPGPGPFVFTGADMKNVWCLAVGKEGAGYFSVASAINRARDLANMNFNAGRPHLPALVLLADLKSVSNIERRRLSSELEETGAIFVDWPKGSESIDDAFQRLAHELRVNG